MPKQLSVRDPERQSDGEKRKETSGGGAKHGAFYCYRAKLA